MQLEASMNLDELVNRPRMYAMEDGVAELMMGLSWAVTGGAFAVFFMLPKGSDYIFAVQAIWLLCSAGMAWGIRKLKARVTIPRGGYVALEEPRPNTGGRLTTRAWTALLFLAACLAFVCWLIFSGRELQATRQESIMIVLASGFAGLLAAIYVTAGFRYRLTYMFYLGGFSALLGAALYWMRPATGGIALAFAFQGAAVALAGGIKLRRFMKLYPAPNGAEA
jgi:hypothetical protein